MTEEVREYIEYISKMTVLNKPIMPKFDLEAYTDSEYNNAVLNILEDFDNVDDLYLTLKHLLGE